jgi:FkbM family methyltransferase
MTPVKTPQGYYAFVRPNTSDEKTFKEIFVKENYKAKKIGFTVEQGETWLDLGANCGHFALYAMEKGAKVYCVDADPQNETMIKAISTHKNFLGYEIKAIVEDSFEKEYVSFFQKQDGMSWKSSLYRVPKSKIIKIKTLKLTELIANFEGELCLKMDIEGAEIKILQEIKDFSKIKKLAFEWSFDKEPRMSHWKKIIKKMQSNFPLVWSQNINQLETTKELWEGHANQYDMVFCRK